MRVVVLTSRHISYNPRVVKEADTLAAAGHHVTVVALCNHHRQATLDDGLMRTRSWRLATVCCRRRGGGALESSLWLMHAFRQRLAQRVVDRWWHSWWIERAQGRETPELARVACRTPADLYIAHHAEALPAAATAACRYRARLAFDAEDFHSGMDDRRVPESVWRGSPTLSDAVGAILAWHATLPLLPEQRRVEYLESTYLPKCRHVTAASPGIAMALEAKYAIPRPTVVRNAFPPGPSPSSSVSACRHAPSRLSSLPPDSVPSAQPQSLKLYWFSQVIGPGRGLEEAVDALALLPPHVELHLRGEVAPGFGEELAARAQRACASGRLEFHAPCPPERLVHESLGYDVGLALETGKDVNNLLAESNKLFIYSLAGLRVLVSDTPAQAAIAAGLPGTALCRAGAAPSIAQGITSLMASGSPLGLGRAVVLGDWAEEQFRLLAVMTSTHRTEP